MATFKEYKQALLDHYSRIGAERGLTFPDIVMSKVCAYNPKHNIVKLNTEAIKDVACKHNTTVAYAYLVALAHELGHWVDRESIQAGYTNVDAFSFEVEAWKIAISALEAIGLYRVVVIEIQLVRLTEARERLGIQEVAMATEGERVLREDIGEVLAALKEYAPRLPEELEEKKYFKTYFAFIGGGTSMRVRKYDSEHESNTAGVEKPIRVPKYNGLDAL